MTKQPKRFVVPILRWILTLPSQLDSHFYYIDTCSATKRTFRALQFMSKPGRSQGQGHPRLKLVVRRLPPTLPAATFWHAVEPFVDKSVWRRYVPGRAGDRWVGDAR